jgi:4-hydroxy-4-methyl-2-oxoglutarate aldolase
LMTVIAQARGCRGLVIDGYVRDSTAIRATGFPVFARGTSIKGTFKQALGWVNHPISCGGVTVRAGDLLIGDNDGVCVVARDDAEWVLEAAHARASEETALRTRFVASETLWSVAELGAVAHAAGLREEPIR